MAYLRNKKMINMRWKSVIFWIFVYFWTHIIENLILKKQLLGMKNRTYYESLTFYGPFDKNWYDMDIYSLRNLFNILITPTFTPKFNGKHPYSVNKVYDRIAKMDVYVDVYFWIGCGPMKKSLMKNNNVIISWEICF